MSDLPSSWSWSTIGELAQYIQRGKSPKYAEHSELPVINQKCIRWTRLELQHLKFIHPEQFAAWDQARYIAPGDILWNSTGTGTVGRAYLVSETDCVPPKVVDSHVTIVRRAHGIDPRYLFNWIKGPAVQSKIEEMCDGTTNQIELSRSAIAATPVPLAPAEEQTRIADQLDKLLARIQACNHRIDAIPALLKRFRQAVLGAAASGMLTEDWRALNEVPLWRPTTIGALTLSSYYGPRFSKEAYTQSLSGIPTVRTTDMDRVGRVHVTDETPRVLVPQEKLEQYRVKAGDLLVTRTGSIGVMAVFDGDYLAIPSAYLIRFRFSADLRTRFAYYRLASPKGQEELGLSATAVTQPNVNAEAIKRIAIELPSPAEQDEIIRRVEALFRVADRIEVRYAAIRTQAQRLNPLLLAKAFRGELVQQDPQDEPASVLLQRLAATQSVKAPTSRGRPRAQSNAPPALPVLKPTDWASLPDGAWVAPADPDGQAAMVWLTAVLRAWGEPMPEREARLASLLCQQPRLFTAVLPTAQATQWSRLVGDEAKPLPTQVLRLQPAINNHWARAIKGMRGRDDLVEAGLGDGVTWALGPGAATIETASWPDGRAGFVVAYLRSHGIASVLPSLSPSAREFVDVRAA